MYAQPDRIEVEESSSEENARSAKALERLTKLEHWDDELFEQLPAIQASVRVLLGTRDQKRLPEWRVFTGSVCCIATSRLSTMPGTSSTPNALTRLPG